MAKGWVLSTCNLPRGGLPRNSVYRITDRPDMASAVDRGRKALTQLNSSVMNMYVSFPVEKYETYIQLRLLIMTLQFCEIN